MFILIGKGVHNLLSERASKEKVKGTSRIEERLREEQGKKKQIGEKPP